MFRNIIFEIKMQQKRTEALNPSFEILDGLMQKISKHLFIYSEEIKLKEAQQEIVAEKKQIARAIPTSKMEIKQPLDQDTLTHLLSIQQDLLQTSRDLFSSLKQVERSTEYDSEKSNLFPDWTDFRKNTELTQKYIAAVKQATTEQDTLKKEIERLGVKCARLERERETGVKAQIQRHFKDEEYQKKMEEKDNEEIRLIKMKANNLEKVNLELEVEIQRQIQNKTLQEQQYQDLEYLFEEIDAKINQFTLRLRIEARDEVFKQEVKAYRDLFEPDGGTRIQLPQKLMNMSKMIDLWNENQEKQMEKVDEMKQEIASEWARFCHLTDQSQQAIDEKYEKQQKLEKLLEVYQIRVSTLTDIITTQTKSINTHWETLEDKKDDNLASFKRYLQLKDILIQHQQQEIDDIKSLFINNKTNLTDSEIKCLNSIRALEQQSNIIQKYEEITIQAQKEVGIFDEKKINLKEEIVNTINADLWLINDLVGKGAGGKSEQKIEEKQSQDEQREKVQWLHQVKQLLETNIESGRVKKFIELLSQEAPIILGQRLEEQTIKETPQEILMPVIKAQEKVQKEEKVKDQSHYYKSVIQSLQQRIHFLEKYLQQSASGNESYRKFYKSKLLAENSFLKSLVTRFSPFDDILSTEVSLLKTERSSLLEKISNLERQHLSNLKQMQSLEEINLALLQKVDGYDQEINLKVLHELNKFQKSYKAGSLEKDVIDYLLTILEKSEEHLKELKDQKIEMENDMKKMEQQIINQESQIKANVKTIEHQREAINQGIREKEKLKILNTIDVLSGNNQQVNYLIYQKAYLKDDLLVPIKLNHQEVAERLIFELGKADAHILINFAEHIQSLQEKLQDALTRAADKEIYQSLLSEQMSTQSSELSELQLENSRLKEENADYVDKLDKLEFLHQRLSDEHISLQETNQIYMNLVELYKTKKDEYTQILVKRCVQGAKVMSQVVQDTLRRKAHFQNLSEQIKVQNVLQDQRFQIEKVTFQEFESQLKMANGKLLYYKLQNQNLNDLVSKFDLLSQIQDSDKGGVSIQVLDRVTKQEQPPPQRNQPKPKAKIVGGGGKLLSTEEVVKNNNAIQKDSLKQLLLMNQEALLLQGVSKSFLQSIQSNRLLQDLALSQNEIESTKHQLHLHQFVSQSQSSVIKHLVTKSQRLQSQVIQEQGIKFTALMQNLYMSREIMSIIYNGKMQFEEEQEVKKLQKKQFDKIVIQTKLMQDRAEALEKVNVQPYFWKDVPDLLLSQHVKDQQTISDLKNKIQTQLKSLNTARIADLDFKSRFEILKQKFTDSYLEKQLDLQYLQNFQKFDNEYQQYLLDNIEVIQSNYKIQQKDLENAKDKLQNLEQLLQKNNITFEQQQPEEAFIQFDTNILWLQLNRFKTDLQDQNDRLKNELDSFKTHFSKYEPNAEENKAKEGIRNQVVYDMSFLIKERKVQNSIIQVLQQQMHQNQNEYYKLKQKYTIEKKNSEKMEKKLKEEQENNTKLLQQVIILEKDSPQIVQSYNSLQNLQDFDKLRNLEIQNKNLSFSIEKLKKEFTFQKIDLGGKDHQIKVLNQNLKNLKTTALDLEKDNIKLKVQIDMGNYQSIVYSKKAGQIGSKNQEIVEQLTAEKSKTLDLQTKIESMSQQIKDLQLEIANLVEINQKQNLALQKTEPQHSFQPDLNDLQIRLAKQRIQNVYLQSQNDNLQTINLELKQSYNLYQLEIKAHHDLNTHNLIKVFDDDIFFTTLNSLKERFLNILSIYLDEITVLKQQVIQQQETINQMDQLTADLQVQNKVNMLKINNFEVKVDSLNILVEQLRSKYFEMQNSLTEGNVYVIDNNFLENFEQLQNSQEINFNRNMIEIIQKHSEQQNEKFSKLNALLADTLNQFVIFKGGPGVLKYQQRMFFMWEQLQNFELMVKKLVQKIDKIQKEKDEDYDQDPLINELVKLYQKQIVNIKQLILIEGLELKDKIVDQSKHLPPSIDTRMIEHNQNLVSNHEQTLQNLKQSYDEKMRKKESEYQALEKEYEKLEINQDLRQTLLKAIGMQDSERDQFVKETEKLSQEIAKLNSEVKNERQQRMELEEFIHKLKREKMIQEFKKEDALIRYDSNDDNPPDVIDLNTLLDPNFDLVGIVRANKKFENENMQLKQHIYELQKTLREKNFDPVDQPELIQKIPNKIILKQPSQKAQILNQTKEDLDDYYYGQNTTPDPFTNLEAFQSSEIKKIKNEKHLKSVNVKEITKTIDAIPYGKQNADQIQFVRNRPQSGLKSSGLSRNSIPAQNFGGGRQNLQGRTVFISDSASVRQQQNNSTLLPPHQRNTSSFNTPGPKKYIFETNNNLQKLPTLGQMNINKYNSQFLPDISRARK